MSPHPSWLGEVPGGGYSLEYSEPVLNTALPAMPVSPVRNVSLPSKSGEVPGGHYRLEYSECVLNTALSASVTCGEGLLTPQGQVGSVLGVIV